jgi:type IV secretion system protein VirD4
MKKIGEYAFYLALADILLVACGWGAVRLGVEQSYPLLATILYRFLPLLAILPAYFFTRFMPFERWVMKASGIIIAVAGVCMIVVAYPDLRAFIDKKAPFTFNLLAVIASPVFLTILGLNINIRAGRAFVGVQREEGQYKQSKLATFGSARLANETETSRFALETSGLLFGIDKSGRKLRWDADGLALVISPTGGGKNTKAIQPWLQEYRGGILNTDPKGQNYAISAIARRLLGHRVYRVCPTPIPKCTGPQHRFNPMDMLINPRADSPLEKSSFIDDVTKLADALMQRGKDDKEHFVSLARTIIAGAIAATAVEYLGRDRSFTTVFKLLMSGEEKVEQWANRMMAFPEIGAGLPALAANAILNAKADERGSMFTTLTRQLEWLVDPMVQEALSVSDFDMADVVRGDADLFICVRSEHSGRLSRLFRLLINTAVIVAIRQPTKPKYGFKLLLNEMAILGRMNILLDVEKNEGVITWGRDYGISVACDLQTRAQLTAAYGEEGAHTWLSQAAMLMIFGVSKASSKDAKEYSELTGETTVLVQNDSQGAGTSDKGPHVMGGGSSGNLSISKGEQRRFVMTADELRRLPKHKAVIFMRDCEYPILTTSPTYYEQPEWYGRYGFNPYCDEDTPQPYAVAVREIAS